MSAREHRRVKTALDETRLLILGAQILFGFHLNSAFQSRFGDLSESARGLHAASFVLMTTAIALLIAPSIQHRIVDEGRATERIIAAATRLAGAALLPFAISLGMDLAIVIGHRLGLGAGLGVGVGFGALALAAWFGAEWLFADASHGRPTMQTDHHTPIDVRVEHMLTEARVLLPGAQALFGFQLAVMFADSFAKLTEALTLIHVAAVCCMALTIILLMAPAAFHRITFGGENTETFHRLGSALIIAAAVPLGLGTVLDLYVAVTHTLESTAAGLAAGGSAACVIIGLWLVEPLWLRTEARDGARAIRHDEVK